MSTTFTAASLTMATPATETAAGRKRRYSAIMECARQDTPATCRSTDDRHVLFTVVNPRTKKHGYTRSNIQDGIVSNDNS